MKYGTWKISSYEPADARALCAAGFSPITAALLCSRGYRDAGAAREFLSCSYPLSSPFALLDMDKAAARVKQALSRREHIAVFGDYDVDGITATCLLTEYLRSKGGHVTSYIPARLEEGYGLNPIAIDTLKKQGVELIVTVDCGITANHEATLCRELGIDLVITDHHQPRPQLPKACAVVDPHRQDCPYPFKYLCGAGVAFKLICAMEGDLSGEEMIWHFGELAAIATVADIVELTGENRLIVQRGLECISLGEQIGVKALIEAAGMDEHKIDSTALAFGVAPRINAAGRLGQTDLAMELLLSDRQSQADELAHQLNELNNQRKALVDKIYSEIVTKLSRHPEILRDRVIVLYGEGTTA